MSSDQKNDSDFEGTAVDLGEDLLEGTSTSQQRPARQEPSPQDDIQRAEILIGERLIDEAKKVLRKILVRDALNPRAKQLLEQIQENELQELLAADVPRKRSAEPSILGNDTSDSIIERLEKDLGISIQKPAVAVVPDLFRDELTLGKYNDHILKTVLKLHPHDRIDVGVAYFEMGLYDLARAIFDSIVRYDEFRVQATYLLGLALIHGGKAIEATLRLEPMARDMSLPESDKVDFLYLMGMAFEALSDAHRAREFYKRVYRLNPRYRDVVDKLK